MDRPSLIWRAKRPTIVDYLEWRIRDKRCLTAGKRPAACRARELNPLWPSDQDPTITDHLSFGVACGKSLISMDRRRRHDGD
jgi:hypothetical protein